MMNSPEIRFPSARRQGKANSLSYETLTPVFVTLIIGLVSRIAPSSAEYIATIDSIQVDCSAFKEAADGKWSATRISAIKVGFYPSNAGVPAIVGMDVSAARVAGISLASVLDKKC